MRIAVPVWLSLTPLVYNLRVLGYATRRGPSKRAHYIGAKHCFYIVIDRDRAAQGAVRKPARPDADEPDIRLSRRLHVIGRIRNHHGLCSRDRRYYLQGDGENVRSRFRALDIVRRLQRLTNSVLYPKARRSDRPPISGPKKQG